VEIINSGMSESVHDCSEGGIAVNLAESAMARGVGARVNLVSRELPAEFVLFGEDASRIVISCDRDNLSGIQQVAVKYGLSADVIGETSSQALEIAVDGRAVVSATISELRDEYENALERALRTEELVPST
jgi:phosphoribosylformylglycinamidine synthase